MAQMIEESTNAGRPAGGGAEKLLRFTLWVMLADVVAPRRARWNGWGGPARGLDRTPGQVSARVVRRPSKLAPRRVSYDSKSGIEA